MDYKQDVETEAFGFLMEIAEDIKQAIINGEDDVSNIQCDESGYGDIHDAFLERVTDRSYSIEDAAYVIANCEEEETDSGIWEGLEMCEAMQACAAYSYGNDVWAKVEEVYKEMFDAFEPSYDVKNADDEVVATFTDENEANKTYDTTEEYEIEEGRGNVDELWQEYENDNIESEIETGGAEELQVLRQWVRLSLKAGTWGGYPFGSVYIDSRCGAGYSMPDVKDFNDYDTIARRKLPSMVGSYIDAVKARIEELEGITAPPVKLVIEITGDTKQGVIQRLQHIVERIDEGDTESYGWKLTIRGDGITEKEYSATVGIEADQWGEIVTGLHDIANQMADGHNEGKGWKLHIQGKED